jgi:dimethylargininase
MAAERIDSGDPLALIALTREVSSSLADGELTHLVREPIDLERARAQHRAYEQALAALGCRVQRLPARPESPDGVFVEDTAVVVDELAVITRPGAASRRSETESMADALASYRSLAVIEAPGTLDGGDVLRLGREVFVGRSSRSNDAGVASLRRALAPFGYSVSSVRMGNCLHLKSAVTEVAPGTLLVNPAWVEPSVFGARQFIEVDPEEAFAANGLRVADAVFLASAFPRTRRRVEDRGIRVVSVELSELAKAEGAVTCCSVVFRAELT